MATFHNRNVSWQARAQTKGHTTQSKTFIHKVDTQRSKQSLMFRYLTDPGNHCNLFYKELKTRGRLPTHNVKPDLSDPERQTLAITKILLRK